MRIGGTGHETRNDLTPDDAGSAGIRAAGRRLLPQGSARSSDSARFLAGPLAFTQIAGSRKNGALRSFLQEPAIHVKATKWTSTI